MVFVNEKSMDKSETRQFSTPGLWAAGPIFERRGAFRRLTWDWLEAAVLTR
jgi:hypothetical protein